MTQKTEGWEIRLTQHIEKIRQEPFKRGENDCALFAGECIEIMTGRDVTSEFRKPYKSKKQAQNLLEQLGYADLEAVATAKLGEKLPSINFAGRGDCVMIKVGDEKALGIVDLSGRQAVSVGKEGLVHYGAKYWTDAWKV